MLNVVKRFVTRNATTKGLLGGSRPWLAVGIVIWTTRFFSRFVTGTPKTVYTHMLEPGETLVIRHDSDDVEVLEGNRGAKIKQ